HTASPFTQATPCAGVATQVRTDGESLGLADSLRTAAEAAGDLAPLAVYGGEVLVDRVADPRRGVVGEGPTPRAPPPGTAAAGPVEGVDHREQQVAGDALVRDPVAVAAYAGELVGTLDTGHVDGDQTLVARQRLEILARQLIEARPAEPRGAGQEAREPQRGVVLRQVHFGAPRHVRKRRHVG